jgi:hypothetical protein
MLPDVENAARVDQVVEVLSAVAEGGLRVHDERVAG